MMEFPWIDFSIALTAMLLGFGVFAYGYAYYLQWQKKRGPPEALANTENLDKDGFHSFPLLEKDILSHDVIRVTFGLPSEKHILGLPIGKHITLKYIDSITKKAIQRSYTPITDDRTLGKFTLVLKVYKPMEPKFPLGGLMSQYVDSLKIGDTILVKGPKGHIEYYGSGYFDYKPLGKPQCQRRCTQIAMMAGGTGITPMYQLIQNILVKNQEKNIQIKLLFANQTPHDIFLQEELEFIQKQFPTQFSIWYTIDRFNVEKEQEQKKSWKYSIGFINKEMIQQHLLFDNKNDDQKKKKKIQFLICGPPPMIKFACTPALIELGYTDDDCMIY